MKWAFLVLLACFALYVANTKSNIVYREVKVENVARVLYHEYKRYTFFIDEGKALKPITISFRMGDRSENVELIPDVPANKHMWVTYVVNENWIQDQYKDVKIHIRSASDINGAHWDHGRGSTGSTTVIQ